MLLEVMLENVSVGAVGTAIGVASTLTESVKP
jgi:hypothetical protein